MSAFIVALLQVIEIACPSPYLDCDATVFSKDSHKRLFFLAWSQLQSLHEQFIGFSHSKDCIGKVRCIMSFHALHFESLGNDRPNLGPTSMNEAYIIQFDMFIVQPLQVSHSKIVNIRQYLHSGNSRSMIPSASIWLNKWSCKICILLHLRRTVP